MSSDDSSGRVLETVLVVASEDDGGMARSVALLSRHLPNCGVRPHLIVHRESPLTATLRSTGTSFDIVPELIETGLRGAGPEDRGIRAAAENCRRAPIAVGRIRSICAARRADVLYSHGTWSNYLAAFAGVGRRAPPVVWHVRNDHSAPVTRAVGRWLARAVPVRAVIAVSQSAARPYEGLPVRLEVVHNGVDLAQAADSSSEGTLRSRLGLGEHAVVVGFAGRLAAHKGIAVLMEAFRRAAVRLPELHLVVLGGSARHASIDEVAHLVQQAEEWGLAPRVHALGYVPDASAYIRSFDLCVVPSTCKDGCPRTAIEALALGVPVVGSDIGGIPELVHHAVNGWLVPPGSAEALADVLVSLGGNHEQRRSLGRTAAAGRERFDARRVAARVAEILRAARDGAGAR